LLLQGAITGLFVGLAVSLWIGFGGPKPPPKLLPMSTDSCAQSGNMTAAEIRIGEGRWDHCQHTTSVLANQVSQCTCRMDKLYWNTF